MIAGLLLVTALLGGAAESAPAEAPPALRTADVVRQELRAEGDALRSATDSLEEARRASAPPAELEAIRLSAERHRIRRGQLQAELSEIRELDDRLRAAGLDADFLGQLQASLAALRAEREVHRVELAAARHELATASSREELAEAEAHLTRAERATARTGREMEVLLQEQLPEF